MLTKFTGTSENSIEFKSVVTELKAVGATKAKLAKKKDSKLCFLLAETPKGLLSAPCGPSISLDDTLVELMFNQDGVVCKISDSGNAWQSL